LKIATVFLYNYTNKIRYKLITHNNMLILILNRSRLQYLISDFKLVKLPKINGLLIDMNRQ